MKWLTRILYGMFGVVVLFTALLFLAPTLPYLGHIDLKIVKSGSMEPSIMTGAVVLVRESAFYNMGDVITFSSAGGDIPTTHRIIGTELVNGESRFVTKGDANEERDTNLVPPSAILGRVLFSIPYAGFIFDFARQPLGFGLLIGLPALLIVVDEVEKIWKEMRRKRRVTKDIKRSTAAEIPTLIVTPYVPTRVRYMDIVAPKKPTLSLTPKSVLTKIPDAKTVKVEREGGSGWVMATALVFALTVSSVNLWSTGSTISYFRDVEASLENMLGAIALGFTATPDSTSFTFVDGVLDDPDGLITLVAPEVGSVPMKYGVKVGFVSGSLPLCDALNVSTDAPFAYDGSLMMLGNTEVSFREEWALDIILLEGAYGGGEVCVVDVVYSGWNALLDASEGGYIDEERVRLTFTAPGVVVPFVPVSETTLVEDFVAEEEVIVTSPEDLEDDGNNGHGNDVDGVDESNPSEEKKPDGSQDEKKDEVVGNNFPEATPQNEEVAPEEVAPLNIVEEPAPVAEVTGEEEVLESEEMEESESTSSEEVV